MWVEKVIMKIFLALLILGVSNSISYQDKSSQESNNNSTREMKNMYLAEQTDQNHQTQNIEGQMVSIQPSSSYQYRTTEDEQLHQNVLTSLNSKIPDVNRSAFKNFSSNTQESSASVSNLSQARPIYQNQGQIASQNFKPSKFIGYQNSKPVQQYNYFSYQQNKRVPGDISQPIYSTKNNARAAQRRNDEMEEGDEDEQYVQYEGKKQDEPEEYENQKTEESDSYGVPKPVYGEPKPEYEDPETRESPFPGIPASGPGFEGPQAFDPLPPPPPPIKGSVDYILIPLILIGLAGPIFVVLYVILGAFEAKLSPLTRRSLSTSYKPYLDSLMTTVGRSLDANDCLEYAACHVGSFANSMGYKEDSFLKEALKPLTPVKYRRTMRTMFSSMKQAGGCSMKNCLKF